MHRLKAYFAALGSGVRLLVLVRTHAEVLDGLTGVPLAAEQDRVRAGWGTKGELVQSEDLTAGLQDALLGSSGEAEGGNGELRNLEQTDIIRDSADDHDDFGVTLGGIGGLLDNTGKGNRGTVDLGEEETVENRLPRNAVSPHHSETPPKLQMTLLKSESVRRARNRYSCRQE